MLVHTHPISINRPVRERVAWADAGFRELGDLFLMDNGIAASLSQLERTIRISMEQMDKIGLVALCRECDEGEGGSCCGRGLENRYDGWLLLINRLMGVELPEERHDAKGCFFLGEKGCLLIARHVICINYVCRKITNHIDPERLNTLRELEGNEIDCLFTLNEQIKRLFREWMKIQKRA